MPTERRRRQRTASIFATLHVRLRPPAFAIYAKWQISRRRVGWAAATVIVNDEDDVRMAVALSQLIASRSALQAMVTTTIRFRFDFDFDSTSTRRPFDCL